MAGRQVATIGRQPIFKSREQRRCQAQAAAAAAAAAGWRVERTVMCLAGEPDGWLLGVGMADWLTRQSMIHPSIHPFIHCCDVK